MHANFTSKVPVAFRIHLWVALLVNALLLASHLLVEAEEATLPNRPTVLGIQGTRFALNGQQTFLLGISYYGALGEKANKRPVILDRLLGTM
jgi:hypothetical protein